MHSSQAAAPPVEYRPATQSIHVEFDSAPTAEEDLPAAQATHVLLQVEDRYVPARHTAHAETEADPSGEDLPGGQAVHVAFERAAMAAEYLPRAQSEQRLVLVAETCVPGPQILHAKLELEPGWELRFAAQFTHVVLEDAPIEGEYLPVAQATQSAEVALPTRGEYLPATQEVQGWPPREYVPASQSVHAAASDDPTGDDSPGLQEKQRTGASTPDSYCPAGHAVHSPHGGRAHASQNVDAVGIRGTHQDERSPLKAAALENMRYMVVTLDVSHCEMSPLKASAL
jgi:hypothetical protein